MELDRIEENHSVMEISNESAEVLPTFDSNFERSPFSRYRRGNLIHTLNSGCLFDDVTQISDTQFEETAFSLPMGNDEEQNFPRDLGLEHLEFEETAYLSPMAGIRQIAYNLESNYIASDSTNTNVPDFIQTVSSSLYQENNPTTSFSHSANQVNNDNQAFLQTCLEGNDMEPVSHATDITENLEMNYFLNVLNFEMLNQQNTAIVDPQFLVDDGENTVIRADEVASHAEDYNLLEIPLTMHTQASPVKPHGFLTENLYHGNPGFEQELNHPRLSEARFHENFNTKAHKKARVSMDKDDPQEVNSAVDPPVQSQVKDAPFTCDKCGKVFSRKIYLTHHKQIHKGEKAFPCATCKKRFADKSQLKKHSLIHTGEKPSKCNVCGKAFGRKDALKRHSRTHTGEKPHKCKVCGKEFAEKGNLNQHSRTHTGEKPHKCDVCGKGFAQKGALKSHSITHT